MRQRGFTLLEMLVAMAVFLLAFTSLYSLFLVGSRHRVKAEGITRGSLAASSLIAEFRLTMGGVMDGSGQPFTPEAFNGDGHPSDDANDDADSMELMAPYPDQPGVWYRVMGCTDLQGIADEQANTGALRFKLKILYYPVGNVSPGTDNGYLDVANWLSKRLNIRRSDIEEWLNEQGIPLPASTEEQILAVYGVMEDRGLLQSYDAIILRRPSW